MKKYTILVVDDTPINIGLIVDLLSTKGYRVLVAENGLSALEQINFQKPDLILLDVLMPEIDGFETCRRLKEKPETADIPVIFMTALSETVDKVKGFRLGAADYITKPFQQEEVLARVRTHLNIKGLQNDLQKMNQTLEAKVERRTGQLRQINSELDTFLGRSSHDLRGPLTTLMGLVSLAEMNEHSETCTELWAEVKTTLQKTDRMVVKLQAVSSINSEEIREAGQNTLAIREFADRICARFPVFAEGEMGYENQIPEALQLSVSEPLLKIIFVNLIENAVNFRRNREPKLRIEAKTEAGRTEIRFWDNGRGVSESHREAIFEMFVRANESSKGHGLGLYLVRKAAEKMGAKINYRGVEDQFADFVLSFPAGV